MNRHHEPVIMRSGSGTLPFERVELGAKSFMSGPSKPSVTDEVWPDERVQSFLTTPAVGADSADFTVLLKAYRGMRLSDFERFLRFYIEAGRDVYAADHRGRTIWTIMEKHRPGAEFLAVKEAVCGE